jgi:hypothetical protein
MRCGVLQSALAIVQPADSRLIPGRSLSRTLFRHLRCRRLTEQVERAGNFAMQFKQLRLTCERRRLAGGAPDGQLRERAPGLLVVTDFQCCIAQHRQRVGALRHRLAREARQRDCLCKLML